MIFSNTRKITHDTYKDMYHNSTSEAHFEDEPVSSTGSHYNRRPDYVLISGPPGKDGDLGSTGPMGPTGPIGPSGGPMGLVGPTGPPGAPGSKITFGLGAPSSRAGDQDMYFDKSTSDVYFSISGIWTYAGNLKGSPGSPGIRGREGPRGHPGEVGATGPRGATGDVGYTGATGPRGATGESGQDGLPGPTGDAGKVGSLLFSGNTAPTFTPNLGTLNKYIDTSNGNLYSYLEGGWNLTGNIRGPQGLIGLTGPVGTKGDTGPVGPVGPVGTVGPRYDLPTSYHIPYMTDRQDRSEHYGGYRQDNFYQRDGPVRSPEMRCSSNPNREYSEEQVEPLRPITFDLSDDFISTGKVIETIGETTFIAPRTGMLIIIASMQGTYQTCLDRRSLNDQCSTDSSILFRIINSVKPKGYANIFSRSFAIQEQWDSITERVWNRTYVSHVPVESGKQYIITSKIEIQKGISVYIRADSHPDDYYNLTITPQ